MHRPLEYDSRLAKVSFALCLVAFGVVSTSCSASGESGAAPRRAISSEARLSAVVPVGWKATGLDTAKPIFLLAVRSKANPTHDDCGRVAGVRTVSQLTVSEVTADQPDEGDRRSAQELSYPPRPSKFGPGTGSGIRQFTPDEDCGEHHQTIRFTDHGRSFVAQLDFAADDPVQRRVDAYAILNSLKIRP
jgi:hypothetical protein